MRQPSSYKVFIQVHVKNKEKYIPYLLSILMAFIFLIKYSNVLPFSGYNPAVPNPDKLGWYGRFLIYAKEDFSYPFGLVSTLGFPYDIHFITRGSIALFAIPLKVLSKFLPYFGQFYYFYWIEFLSVFFISLFSIKISKLYGYRSFSHQFFIAPLVSLSSFVLVKMGAQYFYSLSVAIFMYFVYMCLNFWREPNVFNKNLIFVSLAFPMSYLTDSYNFMGIGAMGIAIVVWLILSCFFSYTEGNLIRTKKFGLSLALGLVLVKAVSFLVGNLNRLDISSCQGILDNRYSLDRAYGGGCGAGYHVSDIFSFIIPRVDKTLFASIPFYPDSNILQSGQYEGYAFIGSGVMLLLVLYLFRFARRLSIKRIFLYVVQLKWWGRYQQRPLSFLTILFLSALLVYIYSWGHIWHFFGFRLNDIYTPSLIANLRFPSLVFARSLGRISFIFSTVIILILTLKYFTLVSQSKLKNRKKLIGIGALVLVFQFIDVSLNLEKGERVKGNPILSVLSIDNIEEIKDFTRGVRAIFPAPALRQGDNTWGRASYSLAYITGKELAGATVGMGILPEHRQRYHEDVRDILNKRFTQVKERYGSFVAMVEKDFADKLKLESYKDLDFYQLKSISAYLIRVN